MNIIRSGTFRFQKSYDVVALSLCRRYATPAASSSSKKGQPPLIEGMPELKIKPEYKGLYDIKQEPGFVIVNGRRYPYPYPGIHGEYNYLELLEKWRGEGKVDMHNRPIFWKMGLNERHLAKKLYFQRDPTIPVWKLGKYDRIWNSLFAVLMLCVSLATVFSLYKLVVPQESDIFSHVYWDRRRKETHH